MLKNVNCHTLMAHTVKPKFLKLAFKMICAHAQPDLCLSYCFLCDLFPPPFLSRGQSYWISMFFQETS